MIWSATDYHCGECSTVELGGPNYVGAVSRDALLSRTVVRIAMERTVLSLYDEVFGLL